MKPIQLFVAVAALGSALITNAEVPTTVTYQGRVQVSGTNFTGPGQFKFALVDAGSVTHWSNDGSSTAGGEPLAAIGLPVAQGLFTGLLGDATLANMTPIPPDVLTNRDVRLRIWFNDGTNGFAALSPDQPLTSAPYALHALNAGAVTGPVPASLLTGTIAPANVADGGIEASKLAANSVMSDKIADGTIQLSDLGSSASNAFWRLGGNNGTIPGTNFIGTTDNRPLEFRANGQTALRVLPHFAAPSLVGGYVGNEVVGNLPGVVIAGGGQTGDVFGTNRVSASHSTISGGKGHTIDSGLSTIGGGFHHTIEPGAPFATISGGRSHTIQSNTLDATIGGGQNNNIGTNAMAATIAGGLANRINANAERAAIGGGYQNTIGANSSYGVLGGGLGNAVSATGGVVGGGSENAVFAAHGVIAGGQDNRVNGNATHSSIGGGSNNMVGVNASFAIVPGGKDNLASGRLSVAAGHRAKANHQGTFVWADSQDTDFASTTSNQFNVRASRGVRFETSGGGVSVDGQSVLAGQVNASQIADGAVTAAKLAANSVTSTAIATGAVDTTRLADGAVTAAKVLTAALATPLQTLTNPTPNIGDQFGGGVVAVSPNRILISAFADDTGANNAGVAHLFDLAGTLLVTITNPSPFASDQFAQAIGSVGNDKILIGAALDDIGEFDVGSAYLYNLSGNLLTTFTNPTPSAYDVFGSAVAGMGGDKVLIGAPGDDTGATNTGAAYLFNIGGTLLATITNPFPANGGGFGATVTAFGTDKFLIGSSSATSGPLGAGAAYLFDLNGGLLATFNNPNPSPDHSFSASMAAVGADKVLIGAFRDDASAANAGAAYLFGLDGTLLTTFANPTPTTFELFGRSVADAGSGRVLIGCPNDTVTGISAGAVYLFDLSGRLVGTLTNANPQSGDSFGSAVSVLGADKVLVGTPLDNTGVSDAGAANLFSLSTYAPGLVSDGVKPGSITSASLAEGAVTHLGTPDGSNPRALQVSDAGAVGIGTTSPGAPLHVVGNVIVEGATYFDIEASRLELGENATAGEFGTAIGFGATATGTSATALGRMTVASGNFSAAIGDQTMATGGASTALGFASVASGGSSTALGFATRASGNYSTAMGNGSIAGGTASFAVGETVEAGGNHSSVGGGLVNSIRTNAHYATLGGGRQNTVHTNAQYSSIGGGYLNTVSQDSQYSIVDGGYRNLIETNSSYATIGGGRDNTNGPVAHYSTISGGYWNRVYSNAQASVIAGGVGNSVSNNAQYSTISGGYSNRIIASATYTTIAGGTANTNAGHYSSINGGWQNEIRQAAESSVIAGGYRNVISNGAAYCVIAGGRENRIAGGAWQATVAGGHSNLAAGYYSFAAGQQARAVNYGSFVWSDGSVGAVPSFGDNTFTARAAGGARFYTIADLSVGVNLPAGGGAWAPISDRAVKDNVRPVDGRDVLEKVAALPLNTWNYKSQDASIRHIGPMAQDFHAAFGVGEDERHITTVDADGVALAAIQGLNQKLQQELRARDAEIGELKRTVGGLKELLHSLAARDRAGQ
jgi:hypothetical protein